MVTPTPTPPNSPWSRIAALSTLLVAGLVPLPMTWTNVRAALDSTRSNELNRADRQAEAGGYYEGLIGGGEGREGARSELTLRLLGKPADWTRFHDAKVSHELHDTFLQFELKRNLDQLVFGRRFTTNPVGMRDKDYPVAKPPGVVRIALLGSSMDMGWGVGTDETYESLFEDWLNAHAARKGLDRQFEVLNFAVAAYSPAQRLESFRVKALAYEPDLVLYSSTMLDTRLAEIHILDLLRYGVNIEEPFLLRVLAEAGVTKSDIITNDLDEFIAKAALKAKLKDYQWDLIDGAVGELVAACHSANVPILGLIIPRVGKADSPDARAMTVARHTGIASRHAMPFYDLSSTFDKLDPARLEIAAWDDHPNALGHRRLFLALARTLARDQSTYRILFGIDPEPTSISSPP